MLSRQQKKLSDFAHHVLGEGEDFHITGSFEAKEENSSIVANASCVSGQVSIASTQILSKRSHSFKPINIRKFGSQDYDGDEEVLPTNLNAMAHNHDTNGNTNYHQARRPLEAINRIISNIRDRNRLLPWKFRKPIVSVLRPSPSLASTQEYQEVVEEDGVATQAADSITMMSFRSSRENLGTGRSLLVRQNAQVFGRPSVAHTKWDISSSLSSSESSGNANSIRRQRSVTLDNTSCSGLSDITEESAFHRIKKIENSFIRRHVVFANPVEAQVGDTYCITEAEEGDDDEDESSQSHDSNRYDFRQLKPQQTNLEENKPWDLVVSSDYHNDDIYSPRQRFFSDSDLLFEQRWRDVERDAFAPFNSHIIEETTSTERLFTYFSDDFKKQAHVNRHSLDGLAIAKPRVAQRSRTHSDSFVSEVVPQQFLDILPWDFLVKEQRDTIAKPDMDDLDGFPFEIDARSGVSTQRSRAHSDSFREPSNDELRKKLRARAQSLDPHKGFALNQEFRDAMDEEQDSEMVSNARRLSSLLLTVNRQPVLGTTMSRDSSEMTLLSSSLSSGNLVEESEHANIQAGAPQQLNHSSSPRTLIGVGAIVDSSRTTLSSPQFLRTHEYYWGDSPVDEDVVWPSVGSEDTFDDIF
ncbi:hypothetical protein IV203_009351 [Nitzschia inconspicua]|uniref:Uncharacterized protein n=1 Tax=Nitzschia inconspicua TaxID=303405 RepID=A0A9K3L0T5_9STRA|nr:hypothetical protein IV203_009351 [Nitzschia inconspicua]